MSYGELENGGGRQEPISLYADKKILQEYKLYNSAMILMSIYLGVFS